MSGTFSTLLQNAHERGATADVLPLLMEASRFRPAFTRFEQAPKPVTLASGGGGSEAPKLICVPSWFGGAAPYEFTRFAQHFEGRRDVHALTLPGFGREERLPASWDAATDALAAAARKAAGDDPFVLVGYSIGGVIAHAIAEKADPAAVVMVDTYVTDGSDVGDVLFSVLDRLLDRSGHLAMIDDDTLLAIGAYMRLFKDWQASPIDVPSLLLRAEEPLGEGQRNGAAPPAWFPQQSVGVPGDHFAFMGEGAAAIAEATEAWLAGAALSGSAR